MPQSAVASFVSACYQLAAVHGPVKAAVIMSHDMTFIVSTRNSYDNIHPFIFCSFSFISSMIIILDIAIYSFFKNGYYCEKEKAKLPNK